MEEGTFFCKICGKRLNAVDEIEINICNLCETKHKKTIDSKGFLCWACGRKLHEKSEIAQGICHNCKASINRKIGLPPSEH